MTQTATRQSATPAAISADVLELEVGAPGGAVLDRLANARATRLLAEKAEKPVKAEAAGLWALAASELKQGQTLLVKVKGVVRGKVALKRRAPQVDLDLLEQAFPEAFQACVTTDVFSPQFDPA